MQRWLGSGVLLVLLSVPAFVFAAEARLLMSWKAPYGRPGATDMLEASCDSTRVDTLYLSIDPGRASPKFLGFNATIYFHAPEGESLPGFWRFQTGVGPAGPVQVVFEEDPERGFRGPWTSPGVGQGSYDFSSGSGRLRLIYAVAATSNDPVSPGRTYGVARVLVRRPRAGADGCGRPLCIEWQASALAFGPKDSPVVKHGARFVSLNSPGGAVCEAQRRVLAPRTWAPKAGSK